MTEMCRDRITGDAGCAKKISAKEKIWWRVLEEVRTFFDENPTL